MPLPDLKSLLSKKEAPTLQDRGVKLTPGPGPDLDHRGTSQAGSAGSAATMEGLCLDGSGGPHSKQAWGLCPGSSMGHVQLAVQVWGPTANGPIHRGPRTLNSAAGHMQPRGPDVRYPWCRTAHALRSHR